MKKIFTFLFAGAAIAALSTAFTACNDLEETGILPVQASDMNAEIAAFLNDSQTLRALGETLFLKPDESGLINLEFPDSCVIINSAAELPELPEYLFPDTPSGYKYPAIDFDSHTLVIGIFGDNGGDIIVSKHFVVEQSTAIMNITLGKRSGDDFYPTMTMPAYFWGLYPKINASTIRVNVTRKK